MSIVMLCKAESTVLDVAVSEAFHRNLEVSRWVKYRIHGFCKLVGLLLDRHQRLVIAMLLHIEREMAAAKVSKGDEGTIRRRVRAKSNGGR